MRSRIPAESLCRSRKEMRGLLARRRFYLADLAALAARRDALGEPMPELPEGLSPSELAAYASFLYDRLPEKRRTSLVYHRGGSRIAYQKQSYADSAYSLFSEMLDGATVLYTDSGRAAAEQVFSEIADFCILPFLDRDGSLVRRSRAIAEELGLFLVGTASVGAGELGSLTYALYGRALLLPSAEQLSLSLRIPYPGQQTLSLLLAILSEVSASLTSLEGSLVQALLRVSISLPAAKLERTVFLVRTLLPDTETVGLTPFDADLL